MEELFMKVDVFSELIKLHEVNSVRLDYILGEMAKEEVMANEEMFVAYFDECGRLLKINTEITVMLIKVDRKGTYAINLVDGCLYELGTKVEGKA